MTITPHCVDVCFKLRANDLAWLSNYGRTDWAKVPGLHDKINAALDERRKRKMGYPKLGRGWIHGRRVEAGLLVRLP